MLSGNKGFYVQFPRISGKTQEEVAGHSCARHHPQRYKGNHYIMSFMKVITQLVQILDNDQNQAIIITEDELREPLDMEWERVW
jgi:hypothetical protein